MARCRASFRARGRIGARGGFGRPRWMPADNSGNGATLTTSTEMNSAASISCGAGVSPASGSRGISPASCGPNGCTTSGGWITSAGWSSLAAPTRPAAGQRRPRAPAAAGGRLGRRLDRRLDRTRLGRLRRGVCRRGFGGLGWKVAFGQLLAIAGQRLPSLLPYPAAHLGSTAEELVRRTDGAVAAFSPARFVSSSAGFASAGNRVLTSTPVRCRISRSCWRSSACSLICSARMWPAPSKASAAVGTWRSVLMKSAARASRLAQVGAPRRFRGPTPPGRASGPRWPAFASSACKASRGLRAAWRSWLQNLGGQVFGQLALRLDGAEHGLLAVGQEPHLGQPVVDFADLLLIQPPRVVLAIAGDERDRVSLIEQLDGRLDLAQRGVQAASELPKVDCYRACHIRSILPGKATLRG